MRQNSVAQRINSRREKTTMFKIFYTLCCALLALAFASAAYAQQGMTTLNPPRAVDNDGKIEVLEFFAYGCIHCANLETPLAAWARRLPTDVKLKRMPSPALLMGIDSPAIYYSLEAMGQLERLHTKLFEAAHIDNVILGNPGILNNWLEKNGVDTKKYAEVQKSFSVATKINRARRSIGDYNIELTPTLVVNGRYALVQTGETVDAFLTRLDLVIGLARSGK